MKEAGMRKNYTPRKMYELAVILCTLSSFFMVILTTQVSGLDILTSEIDSPDLIGVDSRSQVLHGLFKVHVGKVVKGDGTVVDIPKVPEEHDVG